MNTPTISDEAREAAVKEILQVTNSRYEPIGHHVQLAINKATEKLTQENESLQKQVMGLREAIAAIFDPITGCEDIDKTYNYRLGWSFSTNSKVAEDLQDALSSTPDFSKKFVKREVLENFVKHFNYHIPLSGGKPCPCDKCKALTLAKAELEEGK